VESEALPYELLVIAVMIDEALRNWGFDFILTGHHRADIACQQR
jgi:tRNA(Ile)-lysidine synthase TilS/MesJ